MIFMGWFLGWKKVRGSIMERGSVDLVFYTGQENFILGGFKAAEKDPDIGIVHDQLDAQHALLQRAPDGGLLLTDLGSNQGTWVWEKNSWRELVPLTEEYHLSPGQSFAMGIVREQKFSKILDPRFAVQLIPYPEKDPFVWHLTTRLKNEGRNILIDRSSALPKSENIIFKDVGERDLKAIVQLQDLAFHLAEKGHYDWAMEYHRQALRLAMDRVKALPAEASSRDHQNVLRELGNVRIHYADFLVLMGDLVEAAFQYNSAGQELHLSRLKGEEKYLEYLAKGRAYQIFFHLAREQELRQLYWKAAFYYEAAGVTVPLTHGLAFLGENFNPVREALYCFLQAVFLYRMEEPDRNDWVDRVKEEMMKVPGRAQDLAIEVGGMREKIRQLVLALDNPRLDKGHLLRFLQGLFP